LPRLLAASERIEEQDVPDEDLRLLLTPGSSLGGARPKVSVRDRDGALAVAKFPHRMDELDVEVWEAVALTLAVKRACACPSGGWKPSPAIRCCYCGASTGGGAGACHCGGGREGRGRVAAGGRADGDRASADRPHGVGL